METQFSKDKLREVINTIVAETEEEECNANNVNMDTFCQYPATTNTPIEKTDVENERKISLDNLTGTLKGFNKLMLDSTLNNSADDHSNKNFTKSDPNSDLLVATHTSDENERKITNTDTTKENPQHKLLMNREIPAIIQCIIPLVKKMTVDGVAIIGRDLHAIHTVLHKEIVTGAMCSTPGVLKYPPVVSWKDTGGMIPVDRNTVGTPPRTITQVRSGTGPSVSTIIVGL